MRDSERGQATVEWSALALLLALLFATAGFAVARTGAWGFGEGIVHALVCAVEGGCEERDSLDLAYGDDVAALVRRYSPNVVYEHSSAALPIDFRRCRRTECSDGSDAPRAIDRSRAGLPVTAFTRVVDRRTRGGALYLQYWFYYPESFTGGIGRMLGDSWPGYHPDDWEGYQVRVAPGGNLSARATAHGGYGAGWQPWTGWMRVSGGSHAGHLVERRTGERSTTASKMALVPLERLTGTSRHRFEVSPPWNKDVYRQPESAGS
jgi:hypothetical protein